MYHNGEQLVYQEDLSNVEEPYRAHLYHVQKAGCNLRKFTPLLQVS